MATPRKRPEDKLKPGPKSWRPTEADLKEIEDCAALGLTKEDIATILGIGHSQFYRRMQERPEIGEAFSRGRARDKREALEEARTAARLVRAVANGEIDAKGVLGPAVTAAFERLKRLHGVDGKERLEISGPDGAPIATTGTLQVSGDVNARLALYAQAARRVFSATTPDLLPAGAPKDGGGGA